MIAPIPSLSTIEEKERELEDVRNFPEDEFASIIADVGFSCTCCARCCTREYNEHVFLLDEDVPVIRRVDPDALIPAPGYDFCDQYGTFYVSGYALRTDEAGACHFLERGRCTQYLQRPFICRCYPHMLHREPDARGAIDWRQISGLDEHGEYNVPIDPAECQRIARETKRYEVASLEHEIAFLKLIRSYFQQQGFRHVRRTYDLQMRKLREGHAVEVMVFYQGSFERCRAVR
jgi:Fe-S-cluster containining protein